LVAETNSPYDWHSGWALDLTSYRRYPATLRMYSASLYGVADVLPGWSPLHLQRHWEFVAGYPAFVDLAGVEYLLSYRPVQSPYLELRFDREIKIYRNLRRLPRAYLVQDWDVVPDGRERLRRLRQSPVEGRRRVVLEEPVSPGFAGVDTAAPASLAIAAYGPEEVALELGEHPAGYVVLSDTWYPGWRAWVDDRERPILRANHVFRAVEVDRTARRVVFRYRPTSFAFGLWVSLLTGAAVAGFLARYRHLRLGPLRPWPERAGRRLLPTTGLAVLAVLLYGIAARWPLWADLLQRSRVLEVWRG
jgi:hypothetical protein